MKSGKLLWKSSSYKRNGDIEKGIIRLFGLNIVATKKKKKTRLPFLFLLSSITITIIAMFKYKVYFF
jgi:hypothetical protein